MTTQECLQILRDIKDVAFATVDQTGAPQVRMIDIMLIRDKKIYFCTARGKDFYQQLMHNGKAAVTGMNEKYQMVRVYGQVKKLSEQKRWMDLIFEENPSMKNVYPGESRYILEPFVIENGQAEFFDLGKTPIEREIFSLGQQEKQEKGFFIKDSCIGCGRCREVCPQKCIEEGNPYRIRQNHCLHCGLCYEKCPVKAVRKRGA